VFVNLVVEMEAQNIAQWYAIFFCVKLGDNATTTPGKLQQTFVDDACQQHKPFTGTKCFLNAELLLKMSSAEDSHQQHSMGKRICSI
jgi:hypothetical protein